MTKGSHIISSVLAPAVRLWLRSQVKQVEALQVSIEAGDRQILSGQIPRVAIAAHKAVYQGLHLSDISLTGEGIRVNLGQVLRGHTLRLLEPIFVSGELQLTGEDLNASLRSPLLGTAITDFLVQFLNSSGETLDENLTQDSKSLHLEDPQIVLGDGQLTLSTMLLSESGTKTAIVIRTGLQLANSHTLQFVSPQWLPHREAKRGLPLQDLDGWQLDLGPEVDLQTLTLTPSQILCQGKIKVLPAVE